MSNLRIACIGDIMCGDSFYNLGRGVASCLSRYGKDFLRKEIVDFLSEHNLVLGNVECPLSDRGRKDYILRSVHMRGRPQAAGYLAHWGLTVANVANNHILEHGYDAAVDTVRNLHKAGIKTIGAGRDKLFRNGLQIEEITYGRHVLAFIGICLRREKYAFSGGAEQEEVIEQVETLSAQGKIVCISIHWGDEFMDRPSLEQKQTAHSLIKAGAKVVIGHHPHVVQGVERYKDGLIAYSLGNFIFDSFLNDCCWSMMLSLNLAGAELLQWHCVPIEKDQDHRPMPAQGSRKTELVREINRRCELLKAEVTEHEYRKQYEADFKASDVRVRSQLRCRLHKGSWQTRPIYWPQILFRPVQRRLGIW